MGSGVNQGGGSCRGRGIGNTHRVALTGRLQIGTMLPGAQRPETTIDGTKQRYVRIHLGFQRARPLH